jgi:hypothetical protein
VIAGVTELTVALAASGYNRDAKKLAEGLKAETVTTDHDA